MSSPATPLRDYWLVGATVIDATGREPRREDVHVVDGRIAHLGKATSGAHVVDLTGHTLTPGLIDAHVHLGLASPIQAQMSHQISVAEIAADMFFNARRTLHEGFTTVRDCGGIDAGFAKALSSGKATGPRVIQCGPIQCQTGGHGMVASEWEPTSLWNSHHIPGLCSLSLLSDGVEEMRKNVRETFRRGAQFIKMCVSGGVVSSHDALTDTQFTEDEIRVAVQEADARGTYVTVHSHNVGGIRNALNAGALCVEHGSMLDEETAALMAAKGASLIPTIAVLDRLGIDSTGAGLPEHIAARARVVGASIRESVLMAKAAGVRIGSGSDFIGPDQTGRGEEIILRAEIESPMEALIAATRTNAEVLRISDQIGTLEQGKVADLVAWSRDPLQDTRAFADAGAAAVIVQSGEIVKDLR